MGAYAGNAKLKMALLKLKMALLKGRVHLMKGSLSHSFFHRNCEDCATLKVFSESGMCGKSAVR